MNRLYSILVNFKFRLFFAVFVAIFFIYQGISIRWIGYESKPVVMIDEFNYAWTGLSLRSTGLPTSWTTYPDLYKNGIIGFNFGTTDGLTMKTQNKIVNVGDFRKNAKPIIAVEEMDIGEGVKQFSFVMPFFDRPPLGGLIYSLGVDKDTQSFSDVKAEEFRKVSLILGVITSILIYFVTVLVSGSPWISVLAVATYNTVPTFVFASRYALAENIVAPLVLGQLLLIITMIKKKNCILKKYFLGFFLAGLLGGLAVITKESSLGFSVGLISLFLYLKYSSKQIFFFLGGFIIPILNYLIWGLWIQGNTFINIFLANISRPFAGSLKFLMTLQSLRFQDFPIDGWWIWSFFSIFLVCLYHNKKYLLLTIPLISHLLLVIFLGGANYPWYYLAITPFLAIFSSIIIAELFRFPNIQVLLVFFLLAYFEAGL
ncbi:hypothetical protein C4577_07645 [Candidatus Parcubacteria bacterium]|nr:MAG: hypothetical protein C4577_07645 [Candidatus Parcubacteria bacterium]